MQDRKQKPVTKVQESMMEVHEDNRDKEQEYIILNRQEEDDSASEESVRKLAGYNALGKA